MKAIICFFLVALVGCSPEQFGVTQVTVNFSSSSGIARVSFTSGGTDSVHFTGPAAVTKYVPTHYTRAVFLLSAAPCPNALDPVSAAWSLPINAPGGQASYQAPLEALYYVSENCR